MRRGSPIQRQGRTRPSTLPAGRGGGRHLARVAQDRVPLGQGRQAPVPEDPWWPPALSGGRDPPAGRRAPSAADGLPWSGSFQIVIAPDVPLLEFGCVEISQRASGKIGRASCRERVWVAGDAVG